MCILQEQCITFQARHFMVERSFSKYPGPSNDAVRYWKIFTYSMIHIHYYTIHDLIIMLRYLWGLKTFYISHTLKLNCIRERQFERYTWRKVLRDTPISSDFYIKSWLYNHNKKNAYKYREIKLMEINLRLRYCWFVI